MNEWYLEPIFIATVALAFIVFLLIIWISVLGSRLKKLRKQYVAVMGDTGVTNIEEVVMDLKGQLELQRQLIDNVQGRLGTVQSALPQLKSKVGVHRYNAFSDVGSDLSFSIAIIDENKDGIVFSGLHSRESSYVYAKPVEKGESTYPLTPEEYKAIQGAK